MICDLCEEKEAGYIATKDNLLLYVCLDCGAKLVEARGYSCCKMDIKNGKKLS
jgi:hypothetical protein